jgi:hypothetical protein
MKWDAASVLAALQLPRSEYTHFAAPTMCRNANVSNETQISSEIIHKIN